MALRPDEDAILSNDDGSWLQCYMEDGKGRAVVSCVGNWILKTGKYGNFCPAICRSNQKFVYLVATNYFQFSTQ
jgi:hypothetical protein